MDMDTMVELSSGNQMPLMGLGTWGLTNNTAGTVVQALQLGYRMIDTSGDYGTQPGIGEGIRQSGVERENLYIVTKIEETDDAYVAARRNLEELGLDYADLILIHRPPEHSDGEELWHGLIQAREEGFALDIGVSNYSAELIESLINDTGEVPAVNQLEWSPFGHSLDMLDYADENKIVIQAYSPLTRTKRLGHQALDELAMEYGKSPAQILIRWNLQLGTVPIPKANNPIHLSENIDVFDFELTDADMTSLSGLNEHFSVLGELPYVISQKEGMNNMGYRELIKKVQLYSGFSDQESKQALEQTVESLAGMLSGGERQDFASQLPPELQTIAMNASPIERSLKKDIVQYFMDKQNIARDRAKKQVLSAWKALKDAISPGEIDDIRAQLPNTTVALLH